jgi:hypothetical protein
VLHESLRAGKLHSETSLAPLQPRGDFLYMKYSKSEFTLVPSRQARIGMPAIQQVVYMWLCEHSDDNMQSFPSRKVLAYECGISVRTLIRTIDELVSKGFITKTARFNDTTQTSNLYKVLIVSMGDKLTPPPLSVTPPSDILSPPPCQDGTQNSTQLTQPIINSNITNVIGSDEPVSYGKPEINELFNYWKSTTGIAVSSRLTANRRACNNLYRKYGSPGVSRLIDGVAQAQTDQYAPRISDFVDLQAKLTQLMTWGKMKQTAKKGTIKI